MDSRQRLMDYLKRHGPATIHQLTADLELTETAVRHHLHALQHGGLIQVSLERHSDRAGRPAQLYALTEAAEELFPKRYRELLALILRAAENRGMLQALLSDIVQQLAQKVRPKLEGQSPEASLWTVLEALKLDDALCELEPVRNGWAFRAYNCPYLAAGRQVEGVCQIVPQVIAQVTGLSVERPACQRDGARACQLSIALGQNPAGLSEGVEPLA